jgi:hypothetical protein
VVALTKSDKLSPARRKERAAALARAFELPPERVVATSARTGLGIAPLWSALDAVRRRRGRDVATRG